MTMTRSILSSIAIATTISSTFATDRVVSPTGTYNTISGAIAASSDGDRILVQSGTYNEYLSISKSISILPLVEGTRYNVLQRVVLDNADGETILVSGMRTSEFKLSGIYTMRTELQVFDSRFEQCNMVSSFVRTELYRDSILASAQISSGALIGNVVYGFSAHLTVTGTTMLPEDVFIVGNYVGGLQNDGQISINSSAIFHIENNYVTAAAPPSLFVSRPADVLGDESTVTNNVFYLFTGFNSAAVVSFNGSTARHTLRAENNATINYGGLFVNPTSAVALTQAYNLIAAPSWINTSTGEPSGGSPLLNAGDPDPRYLDLDLTTNDIGCYGGSNSRANFTTGMGSAVVGFMQAPRVVAHGEPVNISATGFDR